MGAGERFSLRGRRALVTGAARGLGAATATAFAEAGARVVLVDRLERELAATAAAIGGAATSISGDLVDRTALPALLDRSEAAAGGPIDVVVHSAGLQHREPAVEFDPGAWDRVLAVNLSAPFLLSQEIARRQVEAGIPGSHIVIGSIASRIAIRNVAAYDATKAAVLGLVRGLALEWAEHGIRVNGIGPGYVFTELTRTLLDDPEQSRRIVGRTPLGRLGRPEEVAAAAVYLASDAAAFVTGHLLPVDGGWLAN